MILKGKVSNRARPEGCIAESYLADECVAFCNDFIKQMVNLCQREDRNEDFVNDRILEGHPISAGKPIVLSDEMLQSAHRYVLFNSTIVEPYLE